MTAGLANAVVGIWLISSAFFWTHSPVQFTVSWACGAIAGLVGLVGLDLRWSRTINNLVGLVLISASFNLRPGHTATLLNHLLCGLLVIALSLLARRTAS